MRKTTRIAIVTGALALSAVAVPAAQANGEWNGAPSTAVQADAAVQAGKSASRATTFAAADDPIGTDEQVGDTAISNVVVNGGKDVVFGTSAAATVKVTFTATDDSGIDNTSGYAVLYHGANLDDSDYGFVPTQEVGGATNCKTVDATTATCTMTYAIDPKADLFNSLAGGSWKVWAIAQGTDADYTRRGNAKTFSLKRYSKLTTNAAPEPVKKGKTITVTGALTRANWDTNKYAGYTSQSVKLQYKKKGATSYTTLKTVKSGTAGALKTTVTASADGYYRYSFAGTSTTPAVTSTSDFVDVN
ncbi:DUF5707 domain-containing protein [Streptomyces sp. T-3]|nr:DUF5707 domain-containing protein [Streptomyces sp. T-3]